MTRHTEDIYTDASRWRALKWLRDAPLGFSVTFIRRGRTSEQNKKFHAMCRDVADQLTWIDGSKYDQEAWKRYFIHCYRGERWMPLEDGGMIPIGYSSRDLTVKECSDLIEVVSAFGARHGVEFHSPQDKGDIARGEAA